MATYFARKAGNINAADVWATTPSGTAGAVTFVAGDVLMANSFVITVNVSTDLGSTGEIRTDTFGGATAGGRFSLSNGVTLTANVFVTGAATTGGLSISGSDSATVVGNINGLSTAFNTGFYIASTGTINITGNITNGSANTSDAVRSQAASTINITGNINGTGGAAGQAVNMQIGTLNVTGNVIAGSAFGIINAGTGITNVTGQVTGSTVVAISNASTGTVNVVGEVIAGTTAAGITNSSTGTVTATRAKGNAYGPGNTSGLAAAVGIVNSGLGIVQIEELEFGQYGQSPVSGTGIRLKKLSSNVAVFNYVDAGSAKTLVDATQGQMPAEADVRDGVSYASSALTGSCKVPAAASVAFGVPVDATTGTAALTPASVWEYATRTLTAGGGISAEDVWTYATREITGGTVDTLVNAPTVPTAEEIATEVWDTPTSGLTTSGAIGTRLKNTSTVATTGSQLAAALS